MRYRRLDANGDMNFGNQQADFLRNTPETVGQAVSTRLRLLSGEWYLDETEGVPYQVSALGTNTRDTIDPMFRTAILDTPGVLNIETYVGTYLPESRTYVVTATIGTVYGIAQLTTIL